MFATKRLVTFAASLIPAVCMAVALAWSLVSPDPPAAAQQAAAIPAHSAGYKNAPPMGRPGLKVYPCPPATAQAIAARLREEFRGVPGVRIGADDRLGQILVEAPPEIQAQVAKRVTAATPNVGPQPPSAAGAPRQTLPAPASQGPRSQTIQLRFATARQIEVALVGTLGKRLTPVIDGGRVARNYRLDLAGGRKIDLSIHSQANRVTVQGTGTAVDSCVRLIQALDSPRPPAGRSVRLISLRTSSPASVRQVAAAVRGGGPGRPQGRMVTTLFQPQGQGPKEEEPAAFPRGTPLPSNGAQPPGNGQTPEVPRAAGGMIGPVQIEMLEGLDVLIITGHQRDVDRVMEIIQQVEQLSAETEPVIVVHRLRYVNCEALAGLVTPLYEEVYEPRQGSVSITALVNPNSLLLVGRRENVQTVVDLVKRLDRQAAPETEMQVFRLRHAAATDVQTAITDFFGEEPTGLGTRVVVTADVRSGSLIVRASPRDMIEVARLIERLDTSTSPAVDELRVFELYNAQAEDVEQILEDAIGSQAAGGGAAGGGAAQQAGQRSAALQFLAIDRETRRRFTSGILSDVRITSNPAANTLVVRGPADSMELLAAIIHQLDQPPVAVSQIKVFQVINGDAPTLVDMLETLFGTSTGGEPAVQTAAGEGESSLVTMRFVDDVRTNSIIASGTEGDLLVVDAILTKLDESKELLRKTEVYALKNAPAEDVANAITSYLEREIDVRALAEETMSVYEQIEREVTVVAEVVSNKLIVSATERYFDEIMDLVKKLDERPPMVMIEVLIAEVSLNDTDEFGVELGLQDSVLFDRSLLTDIENITKTTQTPSATGTSVVTTTEQVIQAANNEPGFAFNNLPLGNAGSAAALAASRVLGAQGLSHFGVQRLNSELGYGGLVFSASNDIASILIRALKEKRRIDVLSRPHIMTLDNQIASILVGQLVPLVRDVTITEVGQSFSTQPPEEVGLLLEVWPRISPDDVVVMEVDAVNSEVGPEEEGIPVSISATGEVVKTPRINTTRAQTTVLVPSGQTVVIGGLIQKSKLSVSRKVPCLGDIPVLGSLFRFDSHQEEKTELLIILTPHVVRNQGDAEVLKQIEAARMSWCLSDVLELTDDPGLRGRTDQWYDAETDTVYPDLEPGAEPIPVPGGIPGQQPGSAPPNGGPFVPESMPGPNSAPQQPAVPPGPQAGPAGATPGPSVGHDDLPPPGRPWSTATRPRRRHPLSGQAGYQSRPYQDDGQRAAYQWAGAPAIQSHSAPGSAIQLGYDVPPLQNRRPPGPPAQPYQTPVAQPAQYDQPYRPPTAQAPPQQVPLYR